MNQQIKQLHSDILQLCFAVKEKGHDAFYNYAPHVEWSTVTVHLDGWVNEKGYDKQFDFLWTTDKDCTDDESKNIVLSKLNECKCYLQNLLDGELYEDL